MDLIEDFKKILVVKRYSQNTINAYVNALKVIRQATSGRTWQELSESDLFQIIYHLVQHKKASVSYQKQLIMATQLFYRELFQKVLHLDQMLPQHRPKKLPVVLSVEEVRRIIHHTNNLKHKAILSILYAGGLRISEVLALKIADVDSERMLIYIKNGKGAKDRQVPLTEPMLNLLRQYFKEFRPQHLLFEGPGRKPYSATSVNAIIKRTRKQLHIEKPATAHTFRHSYATHLVEKGTDIRIIQKLLGHNSLKTTMIYTHVSTSLMSQVGSPIDDIL